MFSSVSIKFGVISVSLNLINRITKRWFVGHWIRPRLRRCRCQWWHLLLRPDADDVRLAHGSEPALAHFSRLRLGVLMKRAAALENLAVILKGFAPLLLLFLLREHPCLPACDSVGKFLRMLSIRNPSVTLQIQ